MPNDPNHPFLRKLSKAAQNADAAVQLLEELRAEARVRVLPEDIVEKIKYASDSVRRGVSTCADVNEILTHGRQS